jgi:hypothetical protein
VGPFLFQLTVKKAAIRKIGLQSFLYIYFQKKNRHPTHLLSLN